MNKKLKSTHDEFLESLSPKQRSEYEEEFREFLLSELLTALMEENEKSVRELAKAAHVSPTIIQGLRSGSRKNLTVQTLHDILSVFGYILVAEKASTLQNQSKIKIATLNSASDNTFKIGFRK